MLDIYYSETSRPPVCKYYKLGQDGAMNGMRHKIKIRVVAVWGRARYLMVMEAPTALVEARCCCLLTIFKASGLHWAVEQRQ